jgi:hypothetical protein
MKAEGRVERPLVFPLRWSKILEDEVARMLREKGSIETRIRKDLVLLSAPERNNYGRLP